MRKMMILGMLVSSILTTGKAQAHTSIVGPMNLNQYIKIDTEMIGSVKYFEFFDCREGRKVQCVHLGSKANYSEREINSLRNRSYGRLAMAITGTAALAVTLDTIFLSAYTFSSVIVGTTVYRPMIDYIVMGSETILTSLMAEFTAIGLNSDKKLSAEKGLEINRTHESIGHIKEILVLNSEKMDQGIIQESEQEFSNYRDILIEELELLGPK